jgi:hypothetical protein
MKFGELYPRTTVLWHCIEIDEQPKLERWEVKDGK